MISIIVAIIPAIGVIITTYMTNKTNKKIQTIDDIKKELKEEINKTNREHDKTYLTDFLSEVEKGQTKTEIQIKRAYEIYEEYISLNGNSYIHNKWEDLVKEGRL